MEELLFDSSRLKPFGKLIGAEGARGVQEPVLRKLAPMAS